MNESFICLQREIHIKNWLVMKLLLWDNPEGQGGEGSSGWGTHMYTCGRFMLIYGKKHHNIAKQLFSN
jgi:hypothetical protein